MMTIDIRSDTVTRPTAGMATSMASAEVGDDVFGEDPTINALEEKVADYFGAEAALFCPSGTMTNQIAIRVHCRPGDEVICHEYSHIYNYEGGGIALNSGASARLSHGPRGLMTPSDIDALVRNPNDAHAPMSRLLAVENTMNKGGGACYDFETLKALRAKADEYGLAYHMDGARLWNALVAKGDDPKAYGPLFDTISVCLSKGLGCPVGSVLVGTKEHIDRAYRLRKSMGGGMRQAGFLAAAGIYALDHHIERLAEDHAKAIAVENVLKTCAWVKSIDPVETNIVIFSVANGIDPGGVITSMAKQGVKIVSMGEGKLRIVTHLDVTGDQMERLLAILPQAVK